MARLALTVKELPSLRAAISANAADLTFVGGNSAGGGYKFPSTGREVVIVQNADASTQTFTIDSTPDSRLGRERDISAYSMAADEIAMLGPFPMDGWKQSDGMIYIDASDDDVKFAVVKV